MVLKIPSEVSEALQHCLVFCCSEYRRAVPIVLVLGVATTPDKVHQSLSHNASACLAMEVFRAELSTHYLTRVIEKVGHQGAVVCLVLV